MTTMHSTAVSTLRAMQAQAGAEAVLLLAEAHAALVAPEAGGSRPLKRQRARQAATLAWARERGLRVSLWPHARRVRRASGLEPAGEHGGLPLYRRVR